MNYTYQVTLWLADGSTREMDYFFSREAQEYVAKCLLTYKTPIVKVEIVKTAKAGGGHERDF